jgi:hypothetical protein
MQFFVKCLVERYNFFLDQMILLRNKMTRDKLQKDGYCPFAKGRDVIL